MDHNSSIQESIDTQGLSEYQKHAEMDHLSEQTMYTSHK